MSSHRKAKTISADSESNPGNPFLLALGQKVRSLRSRNGITRKALALATGVSERHLANLESGEGNVSVLVLLQVAAALDCSLAELFGDFTTATPEWLMLRSMLKGQDETTLRSVRQAVAELTGRTLKNDLKNRRIALIGLRGAGKSTLGSLLAKDLGLPFIELSRRIETVAGCSIAEIQNLYGNNAYRRYEREALEIAINEHAEAVIATPGGLVSDPTNFNRLLTSCTTVWLQAKPEDHMQRVIAQGDFRPMSQTNEAMQDLKNILASRKAFYSKATLKLDTSAGSLEHSNVELNRLISSHFESPEAA